jgi:group II intron reverse transcriptase/maturase
MNEGKIEETIEGTPQGGVVSPLLANIYLYEMDKQVSAMDDVRLVRYADDLVILCKTKEVAERTMKQVETILAGLKLRLNKTKTKLVNANKESFEFLGFKLKMGQGKLLITPRKKAIEKFKEAVRILTRRRQPLTAKDMVGRLNDTIRGWGNYYKIGDIKKKFRTLDQWIRTRVRTFIEKKISRYARIRLPNYVLKSEYKLTSLTTLIKPHSL